MKIRIGTRGSDLALWQANYVARRLREAGCEVDITVMKTRGDKIDDVPLNKLEGKGFFTVEIERALLDNEVDLAVHSHKDLPFEGPEGLFIVAVPRRASPTERLLIRPEAHDPDGLLLPLEKGANIGTSAPRRSEQLTALRPDVEVSMLRGNVPTRVKRLQEGRYDAIVLASAGIDRLELDLEGLVDHHLSAELFVPAPAQGALAIQIREGEPELAALCKRALDDGKTGSVIHAERTLLKKLGGGCSLPLGVLMEEVEALEATPTSRWIGRAFLGRDYPTKGQPARWATTVAATPEEAAAELHRGLSTEGEETNAGPLGGIRIALAGSGSAESWLARRLRMLGASLGIEKVIATEPLENAELARYLSQLRPGDGVAFTSARAAERLKGVAPIDGVIVAAVGPATEETLKKNGWESDVVGSGGARDLAQALDLRVGARVLFPCAENARHDLEEELAKQGVEVERVPVYRTVPLSDISLDSRVDYRIYASPSSVEACTAWEREHDDLPTVRVPMGAATREAMKHANLRAIEDDIRGPDELLRCLLKHRLLNHKEDQR